jgi:hypothetical protein
MSSVQQRCLFSGKERKLREIYISESRLASFAAALEKKIQVAGIIFVSRNQIRGEFFRVGANAKAAPFLFRSLSDFCKP